MAAEMDKFEKFIKDYDYTKVNALPKFMKRRLDALKKIQLEHVNLNYQYHKEIKELELKYDKLYQPLYEKKSKIINGEHEPTDEECKLPPNLAHEQDENVAEEEPFFTEKEEAVLAKDVKGIPGFWLGCLSSLQTFSGTIGGRDKSVLRYLRDIRTSYETSGEFLVYKLEFMFDENPHFSNNVLNKLYYLRMGPDEKDPLNYEGFEIVKSEGCKIDWYPGKNVTTKTITVKKNSKNGKCETRQKVVERDSFFFFFKTLDPLPETPTEDQELENLVALDLELGEIIRLTVIPRAPLLYSGHLLEDEDEDSDEDDDEELDDEDDSDEDSDSD